MRGIARGFFASAVVYGLLGMLLGLDMAIKARPRRAADARPYHGRRLAHLRHLRLFLRLGNAVPRLLASLHFWLAQASLAVLVIGLWLVYSGRTEFEPLAAAGAIGYAASFAIFAAGAFMAMRAPPAS